MTAPDAALALCRFVHDAVTLLLWGACAFLAVLVPGDLRRALENRLNGVRTAAVILAGATTAAMLPLETAAIGAGWSDALDPTTVRAVLLETGVGTAWQVQGVLALGLLLTLAAPARRRSGTTAVAAGLLLASLALTGHAAMDAGARGIAHRLNDAVHVLAGGAWLGALVPLLPLMTALGDPLRRGVAAVALSRFSAAGHAAVALVIATGLANTMLVLKRWPTDWSSPYQALLAAKMGLVLAMAGLALAHRYWLVPRIATSHGRALRALRRGTIAELGLGATAIACVSLFGLLEPG